MDYHDLLARLGEGSAHPGGFSATLQLLDSLSLPAGVHVLEIGCGTGRTACYLARQGYNVTAVDLHRHMLDKAVRRARKERVDVRFIQADATALPLPDHHVDVVFIESVTIFTSWRRALAEYRRVLKPGGLLVDREMVISGRKTELMSRRLKRFYGIRTLATVSAWKKRLRGCGFSKVEVKEQSRTMGKWGVDHDPLREMDMNWIEDKNIQRMSRTNDRLLLRYGKRLGYAVFAARVPTEAGTN
ncbi:Methyltransferase domain-containing protein [Paenibacillus polysaccharolyticus]|uniref:Methyltransferase domain-containing protein n=1 Tax=Paenibacillus polysaccharolyticus TaxID=582692 RepID=A0A1G5LQZ9_9BACL|nr:MULTISPECIES: class I SAM-dependent methyltransferase [Paenibacillus]SCZ14569.1 Methyltransferase domain-containing protein [Paenibacillus polysaccharolyticus]